MSPRHQSRIAALQFLYRYDLEHTKNQSALRWNSELETMLEAHWDHFQVQPDVRPFATSLMKGILENIEKLDPVIEKHSSNWKLSRMSAIDRNLLRLAAYELLVERDNDGAVVINEAIELAKTFGTEDSASFVNGILDTLYKEQPVL